MKPVITIVDYGMGNLFSVGRAFEHVGATVEVSDSPETIRNAHSLILPGVGAFADGMVELRARRLIKAIKDYAAGGRPLLGICLGMQLLFDVSEEFGVHEGLGLIPGKVIAISKADSDGHPHKVPHIGWSPLGMPVSCHSWDGTILGRVAPGSAVYFVHSFTAVPSRPEHRLADCYYDGYLVSATVWMGNIYGCQFHPEKSGEVGLHILKGFLDMS